MAIYTDVNGNLRHSQKSNLTVEETEAACKELMTLSIDEETDVSIVISPVHIVWTQGGYSESLYSFDLAILGVVLPIVELFDHCDNVVPYINDACELVVAEVSKDEVENFSQIDEFLRVLTGN